MIDRRRTGQPRVNLLEQHVDINTDFEENIDTGQQQNKRQSTFLKKNY